MKTHRNTDQVIETIAVTSFETRLLALNTIIEAARRGAAGRPLAAVASEVQQLAEVSSQAGPEISRLQREGASRHHASAQVLDEIADSIKRVNDALARTESDA